MAYPPGNRTEAAALLAELAAEAAQSTLQTEAARKLSGADAPLREHLTVELLVHYVGRLWQLVQDRVSVIPGGSSGATDPPWLF